MGSIPADSEVKIAFIGAGGMTREHLKAFADIPQARLCGIYSRTRHKTEALANEFGILKVADSIRDLYKENPDLCVIAVTAENMKGVIEEAINYPGTILAEKPVGMNLREVEELRELCASKGARVKVGLNRRSYDSVFQAKASLDQDGGARFIEVFDQQEPERFLKLKGEVDVRGLMFGNSIHVIDLLSYFGRGEVESITPFFKWNDGIPLAVGAAIEFSSGDKAVYHAVWNAPGPWALNVTTKNVRWELRPLEKAAIQKKGKRILEAVELDPIDLKFKAGFRRQAEKAVLAALNLPNDLPGMEDVLRSVKIIDGIYK